MRQFLCLLALTITAAIAVPASAGDVVRWVDDNGVTHFGDRQFAPAAHTDVVIAPANGMEPARYSSSGGADGRAKVIRLERPRLENKRGFRGYYGRQASSRNHTRRR